MCDTAIVTILKMKNGVPTRIKVYDKEYILDHKDNYRNKDSKKRKNT